MIFREEKEKQDLLSCSRKHEVQIYHSKITMIRDLIGTRLIQDIMNLCQTSWADKVRSY